MDAPDGFCGVVRLVSKLMGVWSQLRKSERLFDALSLFRFAGLGDCFDFIQIRRVHT
jgi:hypothetical protein